MIPVVDLNEIANRRTSPLGPQRHVVPDRGVGGPFGRLWIELVSAGPLVVGLLCAVFVLGRGDIASGQPQSPEPTPPTSASGTVPEIRTVAVPADKPHLWPDGNWKPMPADEFQALVQAARPAAPKPKAARIVRAEYSAALVDNTLHAGHLTADVKWERPSSPRQGDDASGRTRESPPQPRLLTLDPMNLAVSELTWTDLERPAVWGTTPDGRTVLLVPPAGSHPSPLARGPERPRASSVITNNTHGGQLRGRWTLRGRRVYKRLEFDLRLPPAVVSTLRLRLPEGHRLNSSAGEVSGPKPTETAGWNRWDLTLGSRTSCRFTVVPRPEPVEPGPLLLAETDLSYAIRQEGFRMQAEFDLEVFHHPVETLTFRLPSQFDLYSVTYGHDVSLAWTAEDTDGHQHVVVSLPDPLFGGGRPIRLRGFGHARPGTEWTLPAVVLDDAAVLNGQLHLKVEKPLELQSFQTRGFRQVSTVPGPAEGDSFTFRQSRPDAVLTVRVGQPRLSLFGEVVNHVVIGTQQWSLTSEIQWRTQSGTTFTGRCTIPRGWEIIEVRAQNTSPQSRIAGWNVREKSNGRRLLTVKFLDALQPGDRRGIQVVARRLGWRAVAEGYGAALSGPRPAPTQSMPSTRPIELPLLRLLDCQISDTALCVSHSATRVPTLQAGPSWQRLGEDDLPEMVRTSSLFDEIQSRTDLQTRFWIAKGPAPAGHLVIEAKAPPLQARLETTLLFDNGRLTERYRMHIGPQGSAVNHLVVYLSTSGPEIEWALPNQAADRLTSRRLPASEHETRGLPQHGELWDLRFAVPRDEEFLVTGERSRTASRVERPALAFVPQASEFQGLVSLHILDRPELNIETKGLVPAEARSETRRAVSAQRHSSITGDLPVIRSWEYGAPTAALTLRSGGSESVSTPLPSARLELRSLLFPGRGSHDLHWAVYRIDPQRDPRNVRLSLPSSATLIGVRLNDRPVTLIRKDGEFIVRYLPEQRPNTIELHYRMPSQGGRGQASRSVVAPRGSLTLRRFDWNFALSPEFRLAAVPDSLSLAEPLAELAWTERLFGPLGRGARSHLFNPFRGDSWRGLLGEPTQGRLAGRSESNPSRTQPGTDAWEAVVPAGWTVHHAEAPSLPERLTLRTWHPAFARRLGGLGGIACLIIGWVLRLSRFRMGGKWIAGWLSLCLVGAWWAPEMYAVALGGCAVGTLVSLLVPRSLLFWQMTVREDREQRSVPSTISYHEPPVTPSLLIVGVVALWANQIAAQDRGSETSQRAEPQSISLTSNVYTILVPTNRPAARAQKLPFVYVTPELVDELEARQRATPGRSKDYLIVSADYQGRIDGQGFATLQARYRVAVLGAVPGRRVHLPISGANLGGANGCLVDGKPQPVQLGPDGKGITVRLPQEAVQSLNPRPQSGENSDSGHSTLESERSTRRSPPPPALPSDRNSENRRPAVTMVDITLNLHPPTTRLPDGGRLRMGIPPVPASRLTMEIPQSTRSVAVPGARGTQSRPDAQSTVTATLGKVRELNVVWSSDAGPIPTPATLKAETTCLVTAHPAWLEIRCAVAYSLLRGSPEFILWRIPSQAVVRDVSADGLLDHSTFPQEDGSSRLLVEFSTPKTDDFVVNATLLLPLTSSESRAESPPHNRRGTTAEIELWDHESGLIRIPALDLLPGKPDGDSPSIQVTLVQVGLSPASDFRLRAPGEIPEAARSISPDHFLEQAALPAETRKPEWAYEMARPAALAVRLEALVPRRRVTQSEEGLIQNNRLEWTYTAQIETTQAAAFLHTLTVDPRLHIESVSLQEDEANRLLRATRVGERVNLFLRDQTTGVQTLVLRGSVPLTPQRETPLPTVRFKDAEIVDADLRLYRDSDLAVELLGSDGRTPSADDESSSADEQEPILVAAYGPADIVERETRPRIRIVPSSRAPQRGKEQPKPTKTSAENGEPKEDNQNRKGESKSPLAKAGASGKPLDSPRSALRVPFVGPVPQIVLQGLLALVSLLAAVWSLSKLFQLNVFEWLQERSWACWGLLGLWWWSCFAGSWIGLLLLAVAGFLALRTDGRQDAPPKSNVATHW